MKVETIWILLKSFIFLNCFNSQNAAGQNFVSIFLKSHVGSFATIRGQCNKGGGGLPIFLSQFHKCIFGQ